MSQRIPLCVVVPMLFVCILRAYPQQAAPRTEEPDQYSPGETFAQADTLVSSGQQSAAIEVYKKMLTHVGIQIPEDAAHPIKPETVKDPELAGEILGRLAQVSLSVDFEPQGGKAGDTEQQEKMARRRDVGHWAVKASISLLEYARDHFHDPQVGLFSLDKRIRINQELRLDYDLLIEDILALTYRLGEDKLLLYAFAKDLQSRSRMFLEALWARRAIAKFYPEAPQEEKQALVQWLSAGYRFGYLLSALRREKQETTPRREVVDWLEHETEGALGDLRQRSKELMGTKDQKFLKKIGDLPMYPNSELGAGFLVKPGLGKQEILVQYRITAKNVYAFVFPVRVKNSDNPEVISLNVAPDSLAQHVANYVAKLRNRSASWKETSKALYVDVFSQILPYLQGKQRVFIVPSGILNQLPFQTLIDPRTEQPMVAQYKISLLPNAELLGLMLGLTDDKHPNTGALVVGVGEFRSLPGLQQSEAEAQAVGNVLGNSARVLLASRGQATRDEVLRAGPRYSVIHISSHAIFDRRAMYSRIILKNQAGEDVPLTGFDFLQPQFSLMGGLVTLSACDSGSEQVDEGEDALGLTPALLLAGARVVVASMWVVEEKSTSLLMVKFYEGLREGKDVDTALYDAEIWLQTTHPEYSDAHFWGSFLAIGDGRFKLPGLAKK